MRNYKLLTLSLCFAVCLIGPAKAQFPTLDVGAIFGVVKNTKEGITQTKVITDATQTMGKINSTLGDTKSSISKYAGDKLEKAREKKAEFDAKKAEIEAKRDEYNEYKAQFEEAKAFAEEAKAKLSDGRAKYKEDVAKLYEKDSDNSQSTTANNQVVASQSETQQTVKEIESNITGTTRENYESSITIAEPTSDAKVYDYAPVSTITPENIADGSAIITPDTPSDIEDSSAATAVENEPADTVNISTAPMSASTSSEVEVVGDSLSSNISGELTNSPVLDSKSLDKYIEPAPKSAVPANSGFRKLPNAQPIKGTGRSSYLFSEDIAFGQLLISDVPSTELQKYCEISDEDASNTKVMEDCQIKFLKGLFDDDERVASEHRLIYGKIMAESTFEGDAVTLKMRAEAKDFQTKVLDNLNDDLAKGTTIVDGVNSIAHANNAMLKEMNKFILLYTYLINLNNQARWPSLDRRAIIELYQDRIGDKEETKEDTNLLDV